MKNFFVTFLLALCYSLAVADQVIYSSPSVGSEVFISGPPGTFAQVCYVPPMFVGPSSEPQIVCEEVELFGAMDPVSLLVSSGTPVRIQGARWAYTKDSFDNVVPLQGFSITE